MNAFVVFVMLIRKLSCMQYTLLCSLYSAFMYHIVPVLKYAILFTSSVCFWIFAWLIYLIQNMNNFIDWEKFDIKNLIWTRYRLLNLWTFSFIVAFHYFWLSDFVIETYLKLAITISSTLPKILILSNLKT